MPSKTFFVYILTNRSGTLYIGVTSNLPRRLFQHRSGIFQGFSASYKIIRLIYFECFGDSRLAIAREKELKGWLRGKKIALIRKSNPRFEDLSGTLGIGKGPE
ncbi:MAG TPA: GIY-YIG nuclease family protein [bacterium]|nr:GIY-YIG nuclease family protein [bacterium]